MYVFTALRIDNWFHIIYMYEGKSKITEPYLITLESNEMDI